jgi:hypothetical protein
MDVAYAMASSGPPVFDIFYMNTPRRELWFLPVVLVCLAMAAAMLMTYDLLTRISNRPFLWRHLALILAACAATAVLLLVVGPIFLRYKVPGILFKAIILLPLAPAISLGLTGKLRPDVLLASAGVIITSLWVTDSGWIKTFGVDLGDWKMAFKEWYVAVSSSYATLTEQEKIADWLFTVQHAMLELVSSILFYIITFVACSLLWRSKRRSTDQAALALPSSRLRSGASQGEMLGAAA